jgi:hypothetical protein
MAMEPGQEGESPRHESAPQFPSEPLTGELPPIPKNVLDIRHTEVLKKRAENFLLKVLPTREERGPDGGSGTLLSPRGLERLSDIVRDEILPELLWDNDPFGQDSPPEENEYRDSYQDGASDNDPEEAWKQSNPSEDSEVGAVWHRDKRFLHFEPKLLAGAALADGGYLLFLAMYDTKTKHYIAPSFGDVGLDFLHPCAVSANDLIGLVLGISYESGIYDIESTEVYLAPPILELDLATIAYGDTTPWMEQCIKQIPMWEETPPSDFEVIRSTIIKDGDEKGNVTAFILCSGHIRTPVDEDEAQEASVPEQVDMGAFWCKFGIGPEGMPEMYHYVYFPPTLEELEESLANLLELTPLDKAQEEGAPEDPQAALSKAPPSELQHDEALERELDLEEVEFSPSSQIELFFENRGFPRASIPDRTLDPLPDVVVRLALDRLDQIFPLNFIESSPISVCLFHNPSRGEYIVGIPPKYLKRQFTTQCDLFFMKCKLEPSEPGSHDITTSFFGMAIQPEPFINATLELTNEDPRGSVLLPLILGAIDDEITVDENGLLDDDTLNELIVSVGFPDVRDQEEDLYHQMYCLAAFERSQVEHLVCVKRFEDGGIVVLEETGSDAGVKHADCFLKESATVWRDA